MKKTGRDLKRSVTLGDLDDLGAQIITVITKTLQEYPTKEDLKQAIGRVEQKVDNLGKKVDKMSYELSDVHRRVIDLEVDTVPRKDFQDLKFLVATHRYG